jgi:hypothetical protein
MPTLRLILLLARLKPCPTMVFLTIWCLFMDPGLYVSVRSKSY